MDPNRIWSSEQIQVHPDLPDILKDYTKEVIRANPPDVLVFSLEYFKRKVKDKTMAAAAAAANNTSPTGK